jgi:hypothetical protein
MHPHQLPDGQERIRGAYRLNQKEDCLSVRLGLNQFSFISTLGGTHVFATKAYH